MKTVYTISELAQEFDITTRTIRFYEAEGLLHPTRNGQARIDSDQDRVHLKLILRGKRLGFSLSESKELITLYDPSSKNAKQLIKTIPIVIQGRFCLLNFPVSGIISMLIY